MRTNKQSVNSDDNNILNKLKQSKATTLLFTFYFIATKENLNCISKESCLTLFNTLYFVSWPAGQVKPKNNFSEAISACPGQALILNPDNITEYTE